jgi:hypothetical protein
MTVEVYNQLERIHDKLNKLDLRTKGAKEEKAKLETELDTLYASLVAVYFKEANDALIQSDTKNFTHLMWRAYRYCSYSWSGQFSSRDALIAIASENLSVWWNMWRLLLKEINVKSVEELTEQQFNIICSRLNITCSALKSKVTFITWILSNGKDNIKFPMKPKFNAVRQDHMLTPRVSFSQLTACKLFEKYSKDELFDQLFSNKKKVAHVSFIVTTRTWGYWGWVTSWKPELKPARSDRTTGYYVTDGESVYFIFNCKRPKDTTTDWRVWICPDNDTWLKIKKQYNLEDPKLCSVATEVKTWTYENTEHSFTEVTFKECID